MLSTAFIEPLPVIEFVRQLLSKDLNRGLNDSDRVKIKKALRGVKVEVTHRSTMRRKYRISGLTSQPTHELSFPIDERGSFKIVTQYFQETYQYSIKCSTLPCLQNEEGKNIDLYISRKCSSTNRLITAKDHASVQLNIGHLDKNDIYTGTFTTFALCGNVRSALRGMPTVPWIVSGPRKRPN